MIKHIVMWKFKDTGDVTKAENLRIAKSLLDALPSTIPSIAEFEVGIDTLHSTNSYDLVLHSAFTSDQNLDTYQAHPEHQKVVKFLREVQFSKVVVDYIL